MFFLYVLIYYYYLIYIYIVFSGCYYNMFFYIVFSGCYYNMFFFNLFLVKKLMSLNILKKLFIIFLKKIYFIDFFLSIFWIKYIYIFIYLFIFLICFVKNFIFKFLKNFYLFVFQFLFIYPYYKFSDYNFLYQYWYRFARNQKNTYLALRFRLVYLNKKKVENEIFNTENLKKDDIQEYFVLKRKNFLDSYLKPVKVRKFIPLIKFRREYFSVKRQRMTFKGLLFFYFKDYENRINNKEQQQKTLRIYEGLYGTLMFQELLKKEDQKQAKFVKMKLYKEQ